MPVADPILTVVAAPNRLPVVAVVLARLNVAVLTVKSPPSILTSPSTSRLPSTSKLFLTVVVPVTAPMFILVAALPKLIVVGVVLAKLNVRVLTVKSPPSILTSPSTSRLFLIFVVPVAAPMFNVVAAPNRLPVVAFVLARLNVAVETIKSPPSIVISPSTSKLLLMLVVPVAAPISIVVAAPAKLTVVAVVLARLNVAVDTVKSPPSILTSPSTSRLFLTVVVPVAAPMFIAVPAEPKLIVLAADVSKLNVLWLVVKSPPSILTSPSTSKLLLMLVVPVAAPISIAVAAPNALTVVAVVLIRLNIN